MIDVLEYRIGFHFMQQILLQIIHYFILHWESIQNLHLYNVFVKKSWFRSHVQYITGQMYSQIYYTNYK